MAGTFSSSFLLPLRILLAEDSLVNQKLAIGLLSREGHTVTVAGDGREAVAAVAREEFDLVLMDVQMPEMDGLEAAAAIRAAEAGTPRHVPIIAMTAHAMKGDRERCLAAGMDDYVSKPIRAGQLVATIERAVSRRRRTDASEPATSGPTKGSTKGTIPVENRGTVSFLGPEPDWSEALAAAAGDRELMNSVMEVFLEEEPQLMAAIRRAVDAGDLSALRLAAHTLKGSLRYLGQTPAFDLAFRLEKMAQGGDLSHARQTLADLERQIEQLTKWLRDYLGRAG